MHKLAIVGSHPATRDNAPWDDNDTDIWVFNEAPQAPWCKRWDAAFQLHKPAVYMSENNYSNTEHWAWLQQEHGRRVIYMQDYDEFVPNSRGYPLEAVIETLPGASYKWFTSTPSYALALALYLGYRVIDVYGVELSSNTEYYRQLPNWVYWVGVAQGLGISLTLHSGQEHFTERLYGYEGEVQIPRDFYRARAGLFDDQWGKAERDLKRIKDRLSAALLDGKVDRANALLVELRDTATVAGEVSGALAEANRCAERTDPIPRQEIEKRAAHAQQDGEGYRASMYHAGGKLEYVFNVWRQTGRIEALQQVRHFADEQTKAAYDLGAHLGIYKENMVYLDEIDQLVTAAGGAKTLASLGV